VFLSGMNYGLVFFAFQVCATNFGDFCQVVGQEQTETKLVRLKSLPILNAWCVHFWHT
jgi:hypothetical protein